jgi:hypothetical protein
MSRFRLSVAFLIGLVPATALALGPTVQFTLPALNTTPSTFGSLPFPNDLYFDQGQRGDGDGTLVNVGGSIGLGPLVITQNTGAVEDGIKEMDGFGTTTAIFFFMSGGIDDSSLPPSPVTSPSLTDSVFCADAATATPVPLLIKSNVDTRIPNVLALLPAPGKPLAAKTTYTCVIRKSVTGGGQPVEPSADWVSVRDGASANSDADAIFDGVVTTLGAHGVLASDIAGMTVFTTESTIDDLVNIRDVVLPTLAVPTADFTSKPGLVFSGGAALTTLFGGAVPSGIATVATGYYDSARFQTHDPNGDGALSDLPVPPSFITCVSNNCETNDERFTRDLAGNPIVINVPKIPFTVVIPSGAPPAGGWPVVIQQHGLGGQRDTILAFAAQDAAKGFASIGIDAVQHGYRYWDCGPAVSCPQDIKNNFGGTAAPDGFIDNDAGLGPGLSSSFLSVNLGFFQAFHNFLGIRDNFRQTYVDLISLVRLLHGHSIDSALSTTLDDTNIFYMGHSLGGLMGAGFVPIEADLKASLLNAAGGGLNSELFLNSSIGAGAQTLVQGVLGLDPANPFDHFSLAANLTQMVIDPGDGVNSAKLLLNPVDGSPRNVIQIEDWGDEVVPNQSNESLAVAAGLPIFDPFVRNLHANAFTLPLANVGTPGVLTANAAGGLATAALLQNGPATHAASLGTGPGTLNLVPDFAHVEEFPVTGQAFPSLARRVRVPNAGVLDAVLDWFDDVVANGTPGTFTWTTPPNYNPVENAQAPSGASTETFFARTVNAGGAVPFSEPTPDAVVDFAANTVASRITGIRSILGSTLQANDGDMPPGPAITVGTPGVLPFFFALQRELPGTFSAGLTLGYSTAELTTAGITPGSLVEKALIVASFNTGTCHTGAAVCTENSDCGANGPCDNTSYTPYVNTSVDATLHTAHAPGVTQVGTYAILPASQFASLVQGGGAKKTDCSAEFQIVDPSNLPFRDSHGRINQVQTCHDGDPTCDADGAADGACTFRVAVCLNQTDSDLPTCVPTTAASYTLVKPTPTAVIPVEQANMQALADALVSLGGTQGGTKQNVITFAPTIATAVCSPLAPVKIAVGKKKQVIRGRVKSAAGKTDADVVKLTCLP